jgi:Cu+-exporting ATPase
MMMSFPEYFSGLGIEEEYALLFRSLNLLLAIPVFFYCASEFFVSAWNGLKQRTLNIDAPIALSLVMTFSRSLYEIFTGVGGGFLDSMSGIVFFMLVGRAVQQRTYRSISFHRDYKSYFPIAVDVVKEDGTTESRPLQDLRVGEQVVLHYDEIVPADAIVIGERAHIDYSFVTGESDPIVLPEGQTVYAGGRNVGEEVVVSVAKPVAASYLTSLWNHSAFQRDKVGVSKDQSIIHRLSRYFTIVLISLAATTGIFWAVTDPSKVLPSVTAMLIVACPCALLLSATYTNGNLLRIFSSNGLFLRDAVVIENLGKIDQIVFDKTGTLTQGTMKLQSEGRGFSEEQVMIVRAVAAPSKHPLSRALLRHMGLSSAKATPTEWSETAGAGVRGIVNGHEVRIGSALFTGTVEGLKKAAFYVRIDDAVTPFYSTPSFRPGMTSMLEKLRRRFGLSLLTGDNDRHKAEVAPLFGLENLRFNQQPMEKLVFIESLQKKDKQVLMIGDGLNDAGALQQSNVGITLADDVNNFTPSCDAILDASRFTQLPALLRLARAGRRVIYGAFACSILYNIVGLSISVQGLMSPLIAAILMPVSTLSIVLITTGASTVAARMLGLKR